MIVDTSALVALVTGEPEAEPFLRLLHRARVRMSAVTLFEFGIVIDRQRKPEVAAVAERLLKQIEVEVVPVDMAMADAARDGYRRFGKGNHAARLNFGDCFAYALATRTGEPLLFKGRDFALTDVRPAA
ncbi:MAG TPA: type II toxin-antitoxin system VapC family toxin [Brevundimonas sp.]|uniref:type II toxin-antitoxin system VapC family toxin n=1 Tax=Brevundimonas sp. TaxID=1871086 RepID=UPI002E130823|nr:type II toxin-antitoxin system VapC family toxin [Brevundimonas sp.]